jgi:hypothetical protein
LEGLKKSVAFSPLKFNAIKDFKVIKKLLRARAHYARPPSGIQKHKQRHPKTRTADENGIQKHEQWNSKTRYKQ